MSSGEIDRLPVNQLSDRYKLARSAVYTRLDALGIKSIKIGNKSYVNAEHLRQLDDLHQFMQRGGTIPEYLESRGIQRAEPLSSGQSSGLSTLQPDVIQLVAAIAAQVAAKLQPPPEPDRFAYFKTLEQAADGGWLLKTSEVAYLLGLSTAEIELYSDRFSEAGFVFTREGYRAGQEVAWRVSKTVK